MSIDAPELTEVLVTSNSDANLWSVAAWNSWSGSSIVTYKGSCFLCLTGFVPV